MTLDSQEWRQLTHYPEDDDTMQNRPGYHAGPPIWEPNSNRISFTSNRNGSHSIYAIHPDGSDLRQLTPSDGDQIWHAWSPDGKWLAFDGTIEEQGKKNYDIYLMQVEGGAIKRLTDHPTYEQAPVFVQKSGH